ncbi:alpha/beta hydrolase [Deinococcus sp. Marseille-Q6407]|uniref:alpha/beta hydrolase n=1 Tax=Deinococcus sp. Marseille-Q6407 TaxID=2969223 RepID=UPI0028FC19CA|nr:alpha/beta hydrolase [Deinococcus sp. Marseille-Q6407]
MRSPQALSNLNRAVLTAGLQLHRDLRYGPAPRQTLDLYAPAKAKDLPVILFIHGGSWDHGDKSEYRFVGESFARAGYLVAVINYHLAPEHRYPVYIRDAALALAWLREHAAQYGGDPQRLFVVGHSAGAFNAVELTVHGQWLEEVGLTLAALAGVVGIAGPYVYDFRDYPTRTAFPEGADPETVMPVYHVRPDAPPHLLLAAEQDQMIPLESALEMEKALQAGGVPVRRRVLPRLNHYTSVAALALPLPFWATLAPPFSNSWMSVYALWRLPHDPISFPFRCPASPCCSDCRPHGLLFSEPATGPQPPGVYWRLDRAGRSGVWQRPAPAAGHLRAGRGS